MPCYQIRTTSIEFAPQNYQLLEKTVKSLGWSIIATNSEATTIATNNGTVVVKGGQATGAVVQVNQLRKEYANTVVEQSKLWAQSKGWTAVKQGNKLVIQKGKTL